MPKVYELCFLFPTTEIYTGVKNLSALEWKRGGGALEFFQWNKIELVVVASEYE